MSVAVNVSEPLKGLDKVLARWTENAGAAADEIAQALANYSKSHHPWMPETGATDSSTKAEVLARTREYVTIVLSAGMEYDVFLELAHDGKWAWLMPAVLALKSEIIQILRKRMQV